MSVATAGGPLVFVVYVNSFRMVTAMCAVARAPLVAGEWISDQVVLALAFAKPRLLHPRA